MKIIDISPVITSHIAVFPGDQTFERKISLDFNKGDHLALSSIQTTLHLGAHTDATNHYSVKGEGIEKKDLSIYLGPAQVIQVPLKKGKRIYPKDLGDLNANPIKAARVLFKTLSFPNPNQWNDDFMSLSPELIHYLSDQKVILVGIDTPSVDPADSKKLESHQKIFETKMSILEGIVLNHVNEGLYTLISLPLNIENADASPVRAVLLENFEFQSKKVSF